MRVSLTYLGLEMHLPLPSLANFGLEESAKWRVLYYCKTNNSDSLTYGAAPYQKTFLAADSCVGQ
jgi:hypothetical protein